MKVEFGKQREAFENKFSEKHKIIPRLERPSALCAVCALCALCGVCGVCAVCAVRCVITIKSCFCVALSTALAADANMRIKTMADFILSHSQAQENERKKKAQKLNKLHSSTQTRAGAMKIPRIDSKYTCIA